jgi:hypothetical protein
MFLLSSSNARQSANTDKSNSLSRSTASTTPPVKMLNAMKLSELLAKNIDPQLYPRIL